MIAFLVLFFVGKVAKTTMWTGQFSCIYRQLKIFQAFRKFIAGVDDTLDAITALKSDTLQQQRDDR